MTSARISKLLIANRGEIACRVMRSARRMGIETVAVYSEADKGAMHVAMADESHCIGPAASQASYLNAERILDTVHRSGSQAVHPGYGFLSENAEFAEQCLQDGIVFVGPPASAIRDMGIKNTSKMIMSDAGVPIIEGYHGEEQSTERLLEESRQIGFPVMIKAVRGGGGKGMRIALTEAEFVEQLESARREAKKSFNDDAMLVEKFIETPRHVEVQVFGDQHDNYVYLFERDCSVQRRHQKVIEEAPAPGITEETRKALGEAAVRAAKAVGYVGAGTVEFVMDTKQQFYFMEMNTRLQVEHPITEMITGLDLVEWQLRVASGETLPLSQSELRITGHAVEARVYAEDTALGFIPTAGRVRHLSGPSPGPGLRVDSGIRPGDEISVHYDPMIAKLIVHSHDRAAALRRLAGALSDYHVTGLPTNVAFLRALALHPAFAAGKVHTGFIEEHQDTLMEAGGQSRPQARILMRGAVAVCLMDGVGDSGSAFSALHGFRVNTNLVREVEMKWEGEKEWRKVAVEHLPGPPGGERRFRVSCEGEEAREVSAGLWLQEEAGASPRLVVRLTELDGGERRTEFAVVPPDAAAPYEMNLFDSSAQEHHVLQLRPPSYEGAESGGETAASGNAMAPMPGVIEKVLVSAGQEVESGQALVTLIAMKMEYTIRAAQAGKIDRVLCKEGETVKKSAQLVTFAEHKE